MTPVSTAGTATTPARHPLLVPLIVACAFFMENLDGTVIATALPAMAQSFAQSPVSLNAGITAYMLTLAVFIPVSGWIADRFGARNVFCSAIAVFLAASLLCGHSDSLAGFVVARICQGVGGAMMVPVGRMIVLRTTEKAGLMRAMAYLTWPALIAPVLGPSVGGFITTYFTWRWIFYMNIPIGVVGIALVWRFIPNLGGGDARPFDRPGFVLSGSALTGLMWGLGLLAHGGDWRTTAAVLAAAVVVGAAALRHLGSSPHPLISLAPFKVATFAQTNFAGAFSRFAVSSGLFVLPLMFQIGFGMSPFAAGVLMLIGAVGSLSTKAIAIAIVRRFGFRRVLTVNSALIALATLACAFLTVTSPLPAIALVMLSCGFTRSLQFTCLNTLAYADMPAERISAASTLTSMMQQVVMGLGVAFGALMLQISAWLRHASDQNALVASDFRAALVVLAAIAFLASLRFARLHADAGLELSGRRA